MNGYDAVVVGSGPNGLAAAIELARAGRSVLVREAADEIGGGLRSGEVTLPGFVHDLCSAIHPMAAASPFFRTVPLQEHGLEWVEPPLPLAHPLDGGEAVVLRRSVEATAEELGGDAGAYARAFQPLVDAWPQLEGALLGPLVRLPRHPVPLARFGLEAIWPATTFARRRFRHEPARALFAGLAAHSIISLDRIASASFGLVLGLTGHAVGWPLPRGGSQSIADALASYLRSLGGEIVTGAPVESLEELSGTRTILCDVTPRQLLGLAALWRWALRVDPADPIAFADFYQRVWQLFFCEYLLVPLAYGRVLETAQRSGRASVEEVLLPGRAVARDVDLQQRLAEAALDRDRGAELAQYHPPPSKHELGLIESAGIDYILPYWMARYYGVL